MSSLTDSKIRSFKPGERAYKKFDARGLYMIVAPSGVRYWRLRYRHEGKEKLLSLGVYPDVRLTDARNKRDEARKLLANGIDPSAQRKATKAARAGSNSLESIAREWHASRSSGWTPAHAAKVLGILTRGVFPWLGSKPIGQITAPEILVLLRRIEKRGAPIIAHRVLSDLSRVFRYAFATGRALNDPAAALRGVLTPTQETHHAALTDPRAIGGLLRAIDGYEGNFVTRCALKLAPLVFTRPGELRKAEWREIDFEAKEWRLPAARMKMRVQHIVPLSTQAIAILRELHPLTGSGRYVFPNTLDVKRALSQNTLNSALRRLGYADEMTSHGWRSVSSTLLNEQGCWNSDAIERQLSHGPRDKTRAAYNSAQHLPERRKMMQWWSNYLDQLRGGVVAGEGDEPTVTLTDLLVRT